MDKESLNGISSGPRRSSCVTRRRTVLFIARDFPFAKVRRVCCCLYNSYIYIRWLNCTAITLGIYNARVYHLYVSRRDDRSVIYFI